MAVLLVVAFHAGLPVPGGFVGVDIFFVISGFVITNMLIREWRSTGRVSLRRFYVRRFKRLTPALALMVSVAMLLSVVLQSPLGVQQATFATAIGAMTLTANIVIATTTGGYFDLAAELNPLLHTWTLSVEEQFYLLFPAMLVLAWSLGRRSRRWSGPVVLLALGLASLASFALAAYGARGGSLPPLVPESLLGYYGPATRAWEFGAGALLALGTERDIRTEGRPGVGVRLAGPLGAALLVASVTLINESTPFPSAWTLLPVVGTVLVIHAGARMSTAQIPSALSSRGMVWLGDLSYSWYLWHWPFVVFGVALLGHSALVPIVAVILSLVPAVASFYWVETPLRTRPIRGAGPAFRLAAIVVGLPLLLAVILGRWVDAGYGIESVMRYQQAVLANHEYPECDIESALVDDCLDEGGDPVYLLGDSHAEHLVAGLTDAANEVGRPISASLAGNCPFLIGLLIEKAGSDLAYAEECRRSNDGRLEALRGLPAGVVVMAGTGAYWRGDEFQVGTQPSDMTVGELAKGDLLRASLTDTIQAVRASGHQVVVVQDVPFMVAGDPRLCTIWSLTSEECGYERLRAEVETEDSITRAVHAEVAGAFEVPVIDLLDSFCDSQTCYTERDGRILYRDADHITVEASRWLTPVLARVTR